MMYVSICIDVKVNKYLVIGHTYFIAAAQQAVSGSRANAATHIEEVRDIERNMTEPVPKRMKLSESNDDETTNSTTSLLAEFRSVSNESSEATPTFEGKTLNLPSNSTPKQLNELLNKLMGSEVNEKYAFYVSDDAVPEKEELGRVVKDTGISTETVVTIKYQKLASFRVRAVSRCTDSMPGHSGAVLHVSFSGDGRLLASGGADCVLRIWDVHTGTPKHICRGHRSHILQVSWSPTAEWIATGDLDGQVKVWDPKTGKLKSNFRGHKKWITSIAWEPLQAEGSKGERFATSSKDKTIKIFNVRTGQSLVTLSGHRDSVESVRWGCEGYIYSCSRDRTLFTHLTRSSHPATHSPIHSLNTGTINVWKASQNKADLGRFVRSLRGHAHRVNALASSSDFIGRSGPFDHKGATFKTIEEACQLAKERYRKMKYGEERLVSCSDDHTLYLWSPTKTAKPIARLTGHQQQVTHVSFSPDGRFIASASFDKKVKLWDGYTGKFLKTFTGHVSAVYQVCWSPDSTMLASGSKDSTVKVWSVRTFKRLTNCPGHADEVYALDWAPNGQRVASGSKDRLVKMWRS